MAISNSRWGREVGCGFVNVWNLTTAGFDDFLQLRRLGFHTTGVEGFAEPGFCDGAEIWRWGDRSVREGC
ncbi:hypothetical protein TIFTF001_005033 [Ficus carica]|uniref:Uncharacterized protein n=1 Tax=Ficus carica TaxID=3494 RepID=A0AA88CWZ8_FICCA|nr:hypothetical protein TIFTF001_005033 [Ficus carica]